MKPIQFILFLLFSAASLAVTLTWDDPEPGRTYLILEDSDVGVRTLSEATCCQAEVDLPIGTHRIGVVPVVGPVTDQLDAPATWVDVVVTEGRALALPVLNLAVQNASPPPPDPEDPVPPPDGGRTLLVLVDTEYNQRHMPLLQRWQNQVHREGRFRVQMEAAQRVDRWDSANRIEAARSDFNFVNTVKPSAVLAIGNVAMIASDNLNYDGHGSVTAWGWSHLSGLVTNWNQYTDTNAFKVNGSGWMTNGPGDGRFDTYRPNPAAKHARVPFVLTFGNLFVNDTQRYTSSVWSNNPYAGELLFPAADEHALFERYMQRNLDYRQGRVSYPMTNRVQGNLWQDRGTDIGFPPTFPAVKDVSAETGYEYFRSKMIATGIGGWRGTFLYWNSEPFLYPYLAARTSSAVYACLVLIEHKSSGATLLSGGTVRDFLRHPLPDHGGPVALAAAWTSLTPKWMPYGPTVLDCAEKSLAAGPSALGLTDTWYGDPTLPMPHALTSTIYFQGIALTNSNFVIGKGINIEVKTNYYIQITESTNNARAITNVFRIGYEDDIPGGRIAPSTSNRIP